MDVLDLREELETLLADYLGTYVLANGMSTPAVRVRATGESLEAGTTVSGLELVILRDPAPQPVRQYRAPEAFRRWTLFLVGWDDNADLDTPAALILGAYPNATFATINVPESVGPRHQIRIELQTQQTQSAP
jgi:hypothetical protein